MMRVRGVARLRQEVGDLARLRVAAQLRFLINRNTVDCHLKSAAARRNHLDRRLGITLPQLSRQTGGSGLIVSNSAVLDPDRHRVARS
jgi:hypothetical protein